MIPTATRRQLLPVVPTGLRLYVVGDIHGRADCLEQVFARIDADKLRYPVDEVVEVYLGDMVDRGPESRNVVELLWRRATRHPTVHLLGNHEVMLLESLRSERRAEQWRRYGGVQTLASYGVGMSNSPAAEEWSEMLGQFRAIFPARHAAFLARCRASFRCGSYFLVHAGIRPGLPLDEQVLDDLLWIRQPFLGSRADHGSIVVHGHTPVVTPEILPNRINLDTGAYQTGHLSCIILEGNEQVLL